MTEISAGHHTRITSQDRDTPGWNGKGMWLAYVKPYTEAVHTGSTPCFCSRVFELPEGAQGDPKRAPEQLPYIAMKTADEKLVPWLASQTDVLAEDWQIV